MKTIALLGLLQAAGPALPPDGAVQCSDDPTAIVVCGHRREANPYRLPALPPAPEQTSILPRADMRVFGDAHLSVETEQAGIGGAPSNRLMARLRIPLGKK
jgi:hypothetical protein